MLEALTQEERTNLLLSVGSHKKSRRTSPIGVADLIEKACASEGDNLQTIASELELKDESILRRFLSLKKLPVEVQGMVSWGEVSGAIPFTTAAEISRLDDEADKRKLVTATLEYGLNKSEVQAVIQRKKRGNTTLDTALNEILKLRPKIEHQHLFMGLLGSYLSKNISEKACSQAIRNGLAKLIGGSEVLATSCRGGRFSFLLTHKGATHSVIHEYLQPQSLESFVTRLIKEENK